MYFLVLIILDLAGHVEKEIVVSVIILINGDRASEHVGHCNCFLILLHIN